MLKSTYVICIVIVSVQGLKNGLGSTPQMGWNTWNRFACQISEDLIRQAADQLVSTGLAQLGYNYLNLDDCWQTHRNPETGQIQADPHRFPSGIPDLVQYAHSKGLKLGLYSDAGYRTCAGRPGSWGFEEIDAKTYSDWDIDYLKYDNCFTNGESPKMRYPPMAQALSKQKKKIFFSMCEWGQENPHEWAGELGNSWRTTQDIEDTWESFVNILDKQVGLEDYAGPGGWNDPDMLEVGNGGMNDDEYQSHFALWALIKAPLLIGCDLNNLSEATRRILMNEEIIAVNQDSLGKQGSRVWKDGDLEVWAGQVSDNTEGVVAILFNRGYSQQEVAVEFETLELVESSYNVRDLVNKKDLGVVSQRFSQSVNAHGVVVVKFTVVKGEAII